MTTSGEAVAQPTGVDVDLILAQIKQNMPDMKIQSAVPTDLTGPEGRIRWIKSGGVYKAYVLIDKGWRLIASTDTVTNAATAVGKAAQNQFALRGEVLLATGAFADAYFSRIYIPDDDNLDTLKCWYRIFGAIGNGTMSAQTVVDGSLTSTVASTAGSTTPTWISDTLDISSLAKGTDYTLNVQIMKTIGLAVTIESYICYLYKA